jgi:hypothetical protein
MFNDLPPSGDVYDESKVAGVTYFVGTDGNVQLDIEIFDYSNESIEGLCQILSTLSADSCYVSTINMIQEQLKEDRQDAALLKIYNHVAKTPNDKAVRVYTQKNKSKPCIRPSDML